MQPPEKPPSLEALGDDIRRMQDKVAPKPRPSPQDNGMALAMRAGLEVVAGGLVGAGVGLLMDKWLGTSPVLFVICFFLGVAGGFLTLYRTVFVPGKVADATEERDRK